MPVASIYISPFAPPWPNEQIRTNLLPSVPRLLHRIIKTTSPEVEEVVTMTSMVAGLALMAYHILFAQRLFQLSK